MKHVSNRIELLYRPFTINVSMERKGCMLISLQIHERCAMIYFTRDNNNGNKSKLNVYSTHISSQFYFVKCNVNTFGSFIGQNTYTYY